MSQDLEEMKEEVLLITRKRGLQAEGTARAQFLRQKRPWLLGGLLWLK